MALRRTKKETGLGNTLPKIVGGSKKHQKGRQGCKTHYLRWLRALRRTKKKRQGWKTHYLRWLMARRRTKKEAGLENTLPTRVGGPKAHLKREGRVGKHTTYEGWWS